MIFDFFGDAVGAENRDGAGRNFVGFLDENHALVGQALDHMRVMDDFVAHIDRRPEFIQRHFDDLDRAFDAGAKTAGLGENNLHGAKPYSFCRWYFVICVQQNRIQTCKPTI